MILLVVGLPIAYWISFSRWRWKFLIESVVALPLVLPPTVLGFYILVAIGPRSPVGQFYADLVGHTLPFTFEGLLFASILYSLPFAVQPFASSFDQVDRRLIEASWTLGVSKFKTFIKLILPLSVTLAGDPSRPASVTLTGDARFVFTGLLDPEAIVVAS